MSIKELRLPSLKSKMQGTSIEENTNVEAPPEGPQVKVEKKIIKKRNKKTNEQK